MVQHGNEHHVYISCWVSLACPAAHRQMCELRRDQALGELQVGARHLAPLAAGELDVHLSSQSCTSRSLTQQMGKVKLSHARSGAESCRVLLQSL